ncbi:MAG: trypsin-like peptidase domain-containing protein [Candidatus Sungbacteria bacterium]|uniref:Trypsin-like peptidase domain-containing protein n=1 Tax=Candidatus Sungiibacteriota bacterium TaxID=2750080 RepID=A0A932YYW2_9BACT|nr:trypsin-like peptidase domain-containing protein [Candidatus Sungbacteria bacterium]
MNYRTASASLLLVLIVPQIVLAAWWNPFSWKIFAWLPWTPKPAVQQVEIEEKKRGEIEALKEQLRIEAQKREELEKKIQNTPAKPAETTAKSAPVRSTRKTLTTPSGAVIDELGNVISGPTKSTPSITSTNITAGATVLSGEEIYSLVSPSIALIKSSDRYGTGFVVEGGKYTMTNSHVVGSDSKVTLIFQNGVQTSGIVLGKNEADDIALIYNNNLSLKAVILGLSDSSNLKTGAEVYALGFPLDYTTTVTLTKGLVSANRQQTSKGLFIQTDATIHPGNSGGPLVNNKGEVIGINKAVVAAQGAVELIGGTGIGFAIPIETAKNLIPVLSQYGQSRYELFPVGGKLTIKRSLAIKIDYNDNLLCSQLGLIGNDLTICDLYKNYHKDYQWSFIEDTR